MKNIVFLTGAGISKDSGIATFRDSKDGLWANNKIEEICTPEALKKDPQKVLDFYNHRRKEIQQAQPNEAHYLIANLEKDYNVSIITQNVDDLHERAGSTHVIHMHGSIFEKVEDTDHYAIIESCYTDLSINELSPNGYLWRPHVTFFSENIKYGQQIIEALSKSDMFVIVGTSLQVSPANQLHDYTSNECLKFYIDPNAHRQFIPSIIMDNFIIFDKDAIDGLKYFIDNLGFKKF